MYFKNWSDLKRLSPIENGIWNKEYLAEYLIYSCNSRFTKYIDSFMINYQKDEVLAELLFDFVLNADYDGSDSQMGAATYIARLDKELLKRKKNLLLQAQRNEVLWKRPFHNDDYLKWL